jgi:protein TonB
MMFKRTFGCVLGLVFVLSAVPVLAGPADDDPAKFPSVAYHLRVVRVGTGETEPGAAIGWSEDSGTPVIFPSEEVWGTPEQLAGLKELLGVERAEAVTGFFVNADGEEPFRFERKVFVGETVAMLSFHAVPPDGKRRAHKITLKLEDVEAPEPPMAEASMLIATDRSVAVAIPGLPGGDWVVLAVTALEPAEAAKKIRSANDAVSSESDDITPPELISKVNPRYPEVARKEGVMGEVVVQAVIDRDGIPRAPMVLELSPGCEELAGSAVEAVSQWRYKPARLYGKPVSVWINVLVKFKLQ